MNAEWLAELRVIGDRGERNRTDLTAIRADVSVISTKLDALTQEIRDARTTMRVTGWFATKLGAVAGVLGAAAASAATHLWPTIHPK